MVSTHQIKVCPSILACNFQQLGMEIKSAEDAGADIHHVDVMDGHFVPNLSFGLALLPAIKAAAKRPLDVHLMITNPDAMALDYARAGADYLSFHIEAARHPHRLLEEIKKTGVKAGLAINPGSPLELLWPTLSLCDFINVMSVNPGFSGQKFIGSTPTRVAELRKKIESLNLADQVSIEVDGGINEDTGRLVKAQGANILVAGNFIYANKDRKQAIDSLKRQ